MLSPQINIFLKAIVLFDLSKCKLDNFKHCQIAKQQKNLEILLLQVTYLSVGSGLGWTNLEAVVNLFNKSPSSLVSCLLVPTSHNYGKLHQSARWLGFKAYSSAFPLKQLGKLVKLQKIIHATSYTVRKESNLDLNWRITFISVRWQITIVYNQKICTIVCDANLNFIKINLGFNIAKSLILNFIFFNTYSTFSKKMGAGLTRSVKELPFLERKVLISHCTYVHHTLYACTVCRRRMNVTKSHTPQALIYITPHVRAFTLVRPPYAHILHVHMPKARTARCTLHVCTNCAVHLIKNSSLLYPEFFISEVTSG